MAIIRKIKLPGETTPRDIGALSSSVIYDGDSGATTTLNEKIQSIFTAIGGINSFEISIVQSLPATGEDHTIYFVPESAGATTHNEYMYVDNQWELIGTTTIDLSDYLQKTDISDWAKAATKPSYTASEVGALPSNTSYVSSVNGLTGTVSITIPSYSLSMSGPTITLTPSSGTASTVTLALWDGTIS